jgi:hypothetical protein
MARAIPEDCGTALILPLGRLFFSFAQAEGAPRVRGFPVWNQLLEMTSCEGV